MQAMTRIRTPKGVGVYLRALSQDKVGTPDQVRRRAKESGIEWASILACWQDVGSDGKPRHLLSNGKDCSFIKAYAEALLEAGVQVTIWGFPRGGDESRFLDRMKAVTEAVPEVTGWLLDPEVYYKWTSQKSMTVTMRGQQEFSLSAKPSGLAVDRQAQATKLMAETMVYAAEKRLSVGVTSYGMADYHKAFPWREFARAGVWGSPQLYTVSPTQTIQGLASWKAHGFDPLLPSVPAFGPNSKSRMNDHLRGFLAGDTPISGFAFWDWSQISRDEWSVLAHWASWFRGEPVIP